jgi:phosphoribosylglycinamide formyltransferase-1
MGNAKLAVLASGEGSNFEALVEAARAGRLNAEIVGLLTNRESCGAITRAQRLKVPAKAILRSQFSSVEDWDAAIRDQLQKWKVDWVALAGFTGLIGPKVLQGFPDRVVNSHPSLLPKFGGKGMYGDKVHSAVLMAGEVETGITVHLLNEKFDEGPVVAQMRVQVQAGDTVGALAERVKIAERQFYPRVLQDLLTGRIKSR